MHIVFVLFGGRKKQFGFDRTFPLSSLSRTCIKIYRAGGNSLGYSVSCLPPDAAMGSSCLGAGARPARWEPEELCSGEGRGEKAGGVAKSHAQTLLPKEEQHAGPGGHLFSQVCSPNVIKIGATYPRSVAATARQHHGCWGTGVRREERLCCFRADGNDDDDSLSGTGRSKWRRKQQEWR